MENGWLVAQRARIRAVRKHPDCFTFFNVVFNNMKFFAHFACAQRAPRNRFLLSAYEGQLRDATAITFENLLVITKYAKIDISQLVQRQKGLEVFGKVATGRVGLPYTAARDKFASRAWNLNGPVCTCLVQGHGIPWLHIRFYITVWNMFSLTWELRFGQTRFPFRIHCLFAF